MIDHVSPGSSCKPRALQPHLQQLLIQYSHVRPCACLSVSVTQAVCQTCVSALGISDFTPAVRSKSGLSQQVTRRVLRAAALLGYV